MASPRDIEKQVQLLVEGKAQVNFFDALLKQLGLRNCIQIHDFGGVTELRRFLRAFTKLPRFRDVVRVGIVRDAEESAISALRSVEDSLAAVQLPAPGTSDGRPEVEVLILPGPERPGMLETLLFESVRDSSVTGCIESFFDCIKCDRAGGYSLSGQGARAGLSGNPATAGGFGRGCGAEGVLAAGTCGLF